MTHELATAQQTPAELLEKVVVGGDLSKLSPAERLAYYQRTCESLGLNPLTRPFEYLHLNNKLVLYARKDATEQLRRNSHVSVQIVARERIEDVYVVTARATMPDGRYDESIGVVPIASLKGDSLANALMKAETKAKRRVTLSICGLGVLDETEIETVAGAQPVAVDIATGEIVRPALAPDPLVARYVKAYQAAGKIQPSVADTIAAALRKHKVEEIAQLPRDVFSNMVAWLEGITAETDEADVV